MTPERDRDERAPATPERTAQPQTAGPAANPFGLLSGDRGPATIIAMQRTAGNQATMRAIAASASPTPPEDGDKPEPLPSDPPDEPKLRPSTRPPGTDDPSFANAAGRGSGPDRPRG